MDLELPARYPVPCIAIPCAHKPKFLRPKTAFRNDCTFGFRFNHVQILPQTMVVIMMVVVLTMIAKMFTSVVCSCFAFRDLLTESITIDEYLFSRSPLNTDIHYTYIFKIKYNRTIMKTKDLPMELNMTSPNGIPKLA